ncbi:MAG: PDZ domain-containing protein, partial [Rhodospirillales bacterium]|nr:PDZ domain-containing protein [Rhodospirillales bacterium]
PWIGLTGQTVDADLAEGLGLDRPGGVVVTQVYDGGPADQAGILKGDVILAVGGKPVNDLESLRFRVATARLGDRAKVEIRRKGETRTKTVTLPLVQAPETPPRNETLLKGRQPLAGAVVVNLSPALAEEIDRPGAWEGVVVTQIRRGSPAHRLRVRVGDVVVAVNRKEIRRVRDLEAVLRQPVGTWEITLNRNGRVRTLEVEG